MRVQIVSMGLEAPEMAQVGGDERVSGEKGRRMSIDGLCRNWGVRTCRSTIQPPTHFPKQLLFKIWTTPSCLPAATISFSLS